VAIVQDDAGIPLRYFAPSTWSLRPFGAYYGPIPIFAEKFQPEMEQLFVEFELGIQKLNPSLLVLKLV